MAGSFRESDSKFTFDAATIMGFGNPYCHLLKEKGRPESKTPSRFGLWSGVGRGPVQAGGCSRRDQALVIRGSRCQT